MIAIIVLRQESHSVYQSITGPLYSDIHSLEPLPSGLPVASYKVVTGTPPIIIILYVYQNNRSIL